MPDIKKDIETLLNLPETVRGPKEVPAQVEPMDRPQIETDFDMARGNIQELLAQGHDLFDLAKMYAENAESTSAFEVATQLLKALTQANKDLLELHEKKKKVTEETSKSNDFNIENAVFVGSTADLQKKLDAPS